MIGFSARTSANATQEQVDLRLDKRRRGEYGPPPGKRAIFFVDDLNLPARDAYGSQPPIELLRQFEDHGGWYGRDNAFRSVVQTSFVAAMAPAGGGRHPVTERYLRHFSLLAVADIAGGTLRGIFERILRWYHDQGGFDDAIKNLVPSIVTATLSIYESCLASLLPTPAKSHYTFNLRDFAHVIQGVTLMRRESIPTATATDQGAFFSHWFPYDRVGVVNADP